MKLYFKLSGKAQLEALQNGIEAKKNQVIEIDLTTISENKRKALSVMCLIYKDDLFFTFPYHSVNESKIENGDFWGSCGELNSLNAISEIESLYEAKKENEAKIEAENKAKEQVEKILNNINGFVQIEAIDKGGIYFKCEPSAHKSAQSQSLSFSAIGVKNDYVEILKYIQSPDFVEYLQKVETKFKNAQEVAAYEYNKKEEARHKQELINEKLKKWGMQHGSELLKARIEENFNYYNLALNEYYTSIINEYYTSIIPDGYSKHEDDFDSCWDYNNPTIEHIQLLREARKNKVFESVKLRKCRKQENDTKIFYYFIVATVKSFLGDSTFEVLKEIDKEEIIEDENLW